jgi:hypothetical protein
MAENRKFSTTRETYPRMLRAGERSSAIVSQAWQIPAPEWIDSSKSSAAASTVAFLVRRYAT